MRFIRRMLVGSSMFAAAFAASAGTVEVSFVDAGHYWDAGNSSWDEAANLKMLSGRLQKLGQRWLPAEQVLKVEVLQVKLAGTVRAFLRSDGQVRVLTGGADWPRLHLRYALEVGGKAVLSGDEWLADTDYTHGLSARGYNEQLYYEKRMLDDWFKARFVDGLASPG